MEHEELVEMMLDAEDEVRHAKLDSWRSYCSEDRARLIAGMTAALQVALDAALGPVTYEERKQHHDLPGFRPAVTDVFNASRHARLTKPKEPTLQERVSRRRMMDQQIAVELAIIKAQSALVTAEIQLYRDHIARLDRMLAEVKELKARIEKSLAEPSSAAVGNS